MMDSSRAVIIAVFSILSLIYEPVNVEGQDVIVQLNNGGVRGQKDIDERGNVYYSFLGIPFAEPPVDNLRFKAPVPKGPWDNVLDATKDGPPCPQIDWFTKQYIGMEDNCLTLNVYTPMIPTNDDENKLDIIFHIHGGGFASGTGASWFYGPGRLMQEDKDFILVSITYRVSVLGFLSTRDNILPGNFGLLDQVEALRWVRNNINRFGGDPNRVTLLGESAGGSSVMFHLLSPLSKGLFHRAVAMSGTVLDPWSFQMDPAYWTRNLAKTFACPQDTTELLKCLGKFDAREIIERGQPMKGDLCSFTFVPTVDGLFLTDTPYNILVDKKHNKVPLMIGSVKDEGDCFFRTFNDVVFNEEMLLEIITFSLAVVPNPDKAARLVKDKYFSDVQSLTYEEIQPRLSKMMNDGMFQKHMYQTVKLIAADDETPTFVYMYDYNGMAERAKALFKITTGDVGVCHGFDLIMIFNGLVFGTHKLTGKDLQVQNNIQKLITDFAKDGKPTSKNSAVEWPISQPDQINVFHINEVNSITVYDETKDDLYNFWIDEVPKALYSSSHNKDEL